jgi:hypothetical protein
VAVGGAPSPYWTVKVDHDILQESNMINEKAKWRAGANKKNGTDQAQVVESMYGVVQMARLDGARALVVRGDPRTSLTLQIVPLP